MPIFQDLELNEEFVFTKDTIPTNNDVLKYVLSRKGDCNVQVRELAKLVVELWEKADCCPHSVLRVTKLFEQIYNNYLKYLKRSGNKNHHKCVSTSPPPQPTRKSSRNTSFSVRSPTVDKVLPVLVSTSTAKSTQSNQDNQFIVREEWDSEYGDKLFNILHTDRIFAMVKTGCI